MKNRAAGILLPISSLPGKYGIGSFSKEARINTPATLGDNWKWRMSDKAMTKALAKKIRDLTKLYARL